MLNEKNKLILQFVQLLAKIRKLFRLIHIKIERSAMIRKVETTVSPFENEKGNLEEKVSISFFLDTELKNPKDFEKQALGISLTIRFEQQSWHAEGEIGWSGTSVGWDNYIDREYIAEDVDEFMVGLPLFVKKILEEYKDEYNKVTGDKID